MTGDNPRLRPTRRRADVETAAYRDAVRRMVRAYGRRVAAGDVEDLAGLLELSDAVDEALAEAVAGLRSEPRAASWQAIGKAAGITRQAAMQRWPQARGVRRPGGQPAHLR